MSDAAEPEPGTRQPQGATVPLGDVEPARSRHAGRRSAVALTDASVVVGTADGDVLAFDRESLGDQNTLADRDTRADRDSLAERWRHDSESDGSVVAVQPFDGGVVVGERGPTGELRLHDEATGEVRWRYAATDAVGDPQRDTRFLLPFVASLASDGERCYAAVRRYERDGEARSFESCVLAFDGSGAVPWSFETDASPIAVDADGDRVAVAFNRCPGDHQHGLVVLDAETGSPRYDWDPGTEGQRRVGDVSLLDDGVVVASHGDYRGYRLRDGGEELWRVDLGTPTTVDGEGVYAYPNHVHATAEGYVFVTGNTYTESEGRDAAALHPAEHTASGYALDGTHRWAADVGGFAGELGTDGKRVAIPGAQHFRTRDADVHGLRLFGVAQGPQTSLETDGILTAVSVADGTYAAVEEPIVYHDEGVERGAYRLRWGAVSR